MMDERYGFSEDEWDLLTGVPLEIYLAMLSVDTAVGSLDDEAVAFDHELEKHGAGCASGSWLRAVFEDAARPTTAQAHGATCLSEEDLAQHLADAREVLGRKVPPSEQAEFCEHLVKFAQSVAAASGGLLPGAPRVSKAEGDLIWRMRQALNLIRTIHPDRRT
jgi:hypothetical protein